MCNSNCLRTLYTQLCRITLVAQVLPRLLAPVFATTSFCTYQHNSRTWTNFTTTVAFFISVKLIGHTFVHCLIFFTAAIRWSLFIPHVDDSSLKSTKDHRHINTVYGSKKKIFFFKKKKNTYTVQYLPNPTPQDVNPALFYNRIAWL